VKRKLKFPTLRRPSPAMGVALVALFLSLGGAGYAAVTLPNASVGASQLRSFAVTNPKIANQAVGYRKIMPGAVGTVRVDKNDVQLRVNGTCAAENQAISTITINGGTTCASTDPTETNTSTAAATALSNTAATLGTFSLTGGSEYLVQADPYITVTGNTDTSQQTVTVSCTLAAGTASTASQTRTATLVVPSSDATASTSIPLTVVAPESANAMTADVTCTGTATDATLDGQATVYALAIQPPMSTTSTSTTATTTTTPAS